MTRIIVTAVRGQREAFLSYLQERLPHLEIVYDTTGDAWDTFMASLVLQGADPAIHIEDDILLTRDFISKSEAVIAERPQTMIQFFSMRQKDLTVGSRFDRKFCMNQCTDFPAGYNTQLLAFASTYVWNPGDRAPYDTMMDAWLRSRREAYWISVPSLVDHRIAKSLIDSRRSSKRQAFTFTDPDGE